jgi:hypothetical protein
LVHQATWGSVVPGHAARRHVRLLQLPLRGFTTVALLASMGLKGKFLRATWDGRGQEALEI